MKQNPEPWPAGEPIPAACTVANVCRVLQIKQSKFYELRKAGKLPCREIVLRLGRTLRYRADDLEAYLAGHEPPAEIASSRLFERVRRAKGAKQGR
jgi:predicted DNA-binding transcriptional regulator AlpA